MIGFFNVYKKQTSHLKTNSMRNLLYILAVIIIIAWAVGFLGYNAGGLIHLLLIIALVSILLGIIQGRRL